MNRPATRRVLVLAACATAVFLVGGAIHMSATGVDTAPADASAGPDPVRHPAIQRLEALTGGEARIHLAPGSSLARFVGFGPQGFTLEPSERRHSARADRAMAFLHEHGEVFGLRNPVAQLQYVGDRQNSNGTQVEFQQMHRGVPVRGGELRAYFDLHSNLVAIEANVLTDLVVGKAPGIDAPAARALAVDSVAHELSRQSGFSPPRLDASAGVLVIHRTRTGTDHLAYEVEVGGDEGRAQRVLVDARDGRVISRSVIDKTVFQPLETRTLSVAGAPTTVFLSQVFADPVVVCTSEYQNNTVPVVTRVGNVGTVSFDVRLQNPGDLDAVVAETVHCLIVESGVHIYDGHVIEAQHYTSTVTDRKNGWAGEAQAYGHAFTDPVVLGQVMTENDTGWSVFWDRGSSRAQPPSATTLRTGKTVAEDTDTTRLDEEIGFIVFERTHGMLGGVEFEAGVGPKTVSGVDNAPPHVYTFDTAFPAAPTVALSSLAGMAGGDGGWSQLHPSSAPTTEATLQLSIDEDQIGDTERSHALEHAAYVVFASDVVFPVVAPEDCPGGMDSECDDGLFCNGEELCSSTTCLPSTGDPCAPLGRLCDEDINSCVTGPALRVETLDLVGIDGNFKTIETLHAYVSPVVVCDVEYETNTTPVVLRMDNVNAVGFDIKLQNPSGGPVSPEDVWCVVVEEGTWQTDGVKFEAQKYESMVTDRKNSWTGQVQSYNHSYTTPTVIGQVMSSNDPDFSVYWQQGDIRANPPSAVALRNGKTVLEDTDTTRAAETIGFIVFESGHGPFLGTTYEAATGGDFVAGAVNAAPFEYPFNVPFPTTPEFAATTLSGVDGGDGAWSQRHATSPSATATSLFVSVDEDQIGDAERSHTTEQLSYLAFEDHVVFPPVPFCMADSDCAGFADFCDGPDTCVNGACVKGQPPCVVGETCNEVADACEGPAAKLETLLEPNVGDVNNKSLVNLTNTYVLPVVVCSVNYLNNTLPVVPRVGNVTGTSFELYLQNPSGAVPAPDDVYCLVVEEGIWNVGGTPFEAQRTTAGITDHDPSWLGTAQSFGNSYTNPVIVGQVMTFNDPLWSVYWQSGSVRSDPPNNGFLRNGKSVLEDPNTVRAAEEVGFIVFERGAGLLNGMFRYEAFLSADFVRDVTGTPPFTHPLTAPFSGDPACGVVSGAGVDGIDGHWPYLFGANPLRQTAIDLALDEDQLENPERVHTTEQVMGIVFEDLFAFVGNEPPVALDDDFMTDEDSPVMGDVLADNGFGADFDPDGDPFEVTAVNGNPANVGVQIALGNGLLTVLANGSMTFDPNGGYEDLQQFQDSDELFTYTIEDLGGLPDTATVAIRVTGNNDPPSATNLDQVHNYTEDDPPIDLDDIVVTDPDGTSITAALTLNNTAAGSLSAGSGNGETYTPGTGVWTVTGTVSAVNSALAAVQFIPALNNDVNTTITTHVEDAAPSGPPDGSIALNVTPVNDPPAISVNTGITVSEGGSETIDTTELDEGDPDDDGLGLTWSITSGPTNGQVELSTNPGIPIASFTQDDLDNNRVVYVHDDSETIADSFDVSLADGGEDGSTPALGTVNITVTPGNDPPTGGPDAFDAVGNTTLLVDKAPTGGAEIVVSTTGGTTPAADGVLDNDSDGENDALSVSGIVGCADLTAPFTDCPTANGGKVTMESGGQFSFVGAPGDAAPTDMFQYNLFDGSNTVPTTVTLTRKNRVWYVRNDNTSGTDDGTSVDPFDTLAEAESSSVAGDTIYVFEGDGTTAGQDAGITLKNQQRLHGEGIDLVVPDTVNGVVGPTVFDSATNPRPEVEHATAASDGVTVNATASDRIDIEIRGLELSGTRNMIDVTATGAFQVGVLISDNAFQDSGNEGIDLNPGSSGAFDVTFESNIFAITSATGNAFDLVTTASAGVVELAFSNNSSITSSAGTAVHIDGSAGGDLFITGFANNSVHGNTAGIGISILSATFDSDTSDADFDLVAAGTTTVGDAGNPVGTSGMILGVFPAVVAGNLGFAQLDIFNAAGTGLGAAGSDSATGGPPPTSGFRLTATTGTIASTGGPAVIVQALTSGMTFATISSTSSAAKGVSIVDIDGTFSVATSTTVTDPLNDGIFIESILPGTTIGFGSTTVSRGNGVAGVGNAVELEANTASTIDFTPLNAITWLTAGAGGAGFSSLDGGTANLGGTVDINAEGGPAVSIDGGTTTGSWSFGDLTSTNSSSDGIKLDNLTNNFNVTGTVDIDDPASEGIEIDGSSVDYTFATVDIDIVNPGAPGIDLNGLTGSFTINSVGGGVDFEPTAADDQHNILINDCFDVTISGAAATCTGAVKTGCFTLSDAGTGAGQSGLGPDNSGFHAIAIANSGDIDLDSIFIDGSGGSNSGGDDSGIFIVDPDADATVDIDGSFLIDVDEDAIEVEKRNMGVFNINILGNVFEGTLGSHMESAAHFDDFDSGAVVAVFSNNTIDEMDSFGLLIRPAGSSGTGGTQNSFTITGNVFRDSDNNAIAVDSLDTSNTEVIIQDNDLFGELNVGGIGDDEAIDICNCGSNNMSTLDLTVGGPNPSDGNTINGWGDHGMRIDGFGSNQSGTINALIQNNTWDNTADECIEIRPDDLQTFNARILDETCAATTGGIGADPGTGTGQLIRIFLRDNESPEYHFDDQINATIELGCTDLNDGGVCDLNIGSTLNVFAANATVTAILDADGNTTSGGSCNVTGDAGLDIVNENTVPSP